MRAFCCALLFALGACQAVGPEPSVSESSASDPLVPEAVVSEPGVSGRPVSGPAVPGHDRGAEGAAAEGVLVRRAMLCGSPADPPPDPVVATDTADLQFERLLRMSCDPYRYRRELTEALRIADANPRWTGEQRAFLELLESQSRALLQLESRREALEQRLEETIRGISEIEAAIDGRPVAEPLEQETHGE